MRACAMIFIDGVKRRNGCITDSFLGTITFFFLRHFSKENNVVQTCSLLVIVLQFATLKLALRQRHQRTVSTLNDKKYFFFLSFLVLQRSSNNEQVIGWGSCLELLPGIDVDVFVGKKSPFKKKL
ncbi:hypothetical protein CHUAL_005531 [Chamberlinius hualienensis]